MKFRFKALILTVLAIVPLNSMSQLSVDGNQCDGIETVTTAISASSFFGDCYDGSTEDLNNLYLRWTVEYPGGTFAALGGAGLDPINTNINWWDFNQMIQLEVLPDWFNPVEMTVIIRGFYSTNGVDFTQCFEEDNGIWSGAYDEIDFTPRNNFVKTDWSCTIEQEDDYTYEVTDVPGVTYYTWTTPANWTIQNGQGDHIMTMSSGSNPQSGQLKVVTTPSIDACGHPATCNIEITDCFYNGFTQYDFCGSTAWTTGLNTNEYGDKMKFPRMIGDFDGDQNEDIIGFGNSNIAVGISTGSSFNTSNWSSSLTYANGGWRQDKYPRKLGDFNGDGKTDVVGFGQSATYVMLSSGSNFISAGIWHSGFDYDAGYTDRNVVSREIGDFNGDGMDDVIGIGYSGSTMALSNGSSFVTTPSWTNLTVFSANAGFNNRNRMPLKVADVNGDGMDDLIGFGYHNIVVAVSTGSGFSVSTWNYGGMSYGNQGYIESKYPRMVGDFNGDGMDDIVGFGHNGIAVGISTGSSFSISHWLNDKEFTRVGPNGIQDDPNVDNDDWILDNREIGVVSNANFVGEHEITIIDMNADGMDDILGFNDLGTHVSYSTGTVFECPDNMSSYSNAQGYNTLNYIRTAGNFDITDDEPEIIGFGYHQVGVMDCNHCPNTNAEAAFIDPLYVTQESGYLGWTIDAHHYCTSNQVILDLTGTECEDGYLFNIYEFDLNTWNSTLVGGSNGWIPGKAPGQLDITNEVNWQTGQLYRVSYAVGPVWDVVESWFIMDGDQVQSSFFFSGTEQLYYTICGQMIVTEFCSNLITAYMYPSASECYDQYRFEVHATDICGNPTGPVLWESSPGGSYLNGPMPFNVSLPMSSFALNTTYIVELDVIGGSSSDQSFKYFRRKPCSTTPKKDPVDFGNSMGIDFELAAYPNPTSGTTTIVLEGVSSEEQAYVQVYAMDGKLVFEDTKVNRTFDLEMDEFENGSYIMRVTIGNATKTIKLMKN